MLLDKFQRLEENLTVKLHTMEEENKKRADEIDKLSKALQTTILTDDGSSIRSSRGYQGGKPSAPEDSDEETSVTRQHQQTRAENPRFTDNNPDKLPAKEAIRLVETLRGRDDVGVEDFIKNVRYARANCLQKALLLRLILVERITDNAKRSIRYIDIDSYEELYAALRQNVSIPSTVSNCRSRLQQIKQGNTETIQSYNLRFRQQLNELMYAVQNKHAKPISRQIAIEEEETEATRTYIMNLRRDIGTLVIPNKPRSLLKAQT